MAHCPKEELEKTRGCEYRFPIAADIYEQLKVISIGWVKITDCATAEEVLRQVWGAYGGEIDDQELRNNDERQLRDFVLLKKGDIIFVPWPNYKNFYIFEATTDWLNYAKMAEHTGIERNVKFTKEYFEKMDIGFFVGVKPLTELISNKKQFLGYLSTVKKVKNKEWIQWIESKILEHPRVNQ